ETAAAVAGVPVDSAYPAMARALAAFTPPAEPLRVDTSFSGTRSDPTRRGHIANVGIQNLTMANLCDGVLNGMVAELQALYEKMRPFLPGAPTMLVGSGNGIRHNPPLAARFAAAFGLPLRVPVNDEEAAFGASLFGLAAAGGAPDVAVAQRCIRYRQ
ncbi:MAG: hypothetical protein J6333_04300, partial [Planctomycetes bacterium]|nr:hypothetical protein [Planctomycetota bacterium]